MSNSKIHVLLSRIERRIELREEEVRSDVHTRWHSDGTDLEDEVQRELNSVLFEDERRGLSLPLKDAAKMAATLKSRLAAGQPPLNPLELFSVNLLSVLLDCGEPVLSRVEVTAQFGPVTLTHQQPLDAFKRGLQMTMVQSDAALSDGSLQVDGIKLLAHRFEPVDDATGFLKTAQLSGRVQFTASWDGPPQGLSEAVSTLLLTLRHRIEAMQPARVSLRHLVLSDIRTE